MWSVALPMYDLPEVRADVDALWAGLRGRLVAAGVGDVGERRDRPDDLRVSWGSDRLLLSQTCGYPLVRALPGVSVVGTFAAPAGDPPGYYRSVIVGAAGGSRRAVNDEWSLSGWISLLVAEGAATADRVDVLTGSHRASVAAVRRREADVASIDAVTFRLLAEHAPGELAGVRVIGRGPLVPCLPLITSDASLVPVLRSVLAATIGDPTQADTLRRLGIAGFVPLERADYSRVAELVGRVEPERPAWP